MRTRIYVDDFNLYYGALKGTPFKGLNLVELARRLLPARYTVDKLNYFTARVSGVSDSGAPARQHAYLSALGTLPEVQVHFGFGSFLAKAAWRPLTNLPVAGRRIDTPAAVTLLTGNHPVVGSQTLPVGSYPTSRVEKKRRRKAVAPLPDAVIAEVHTYGRERFGRKSRGPSFERCLEGVIRCGSGDLERYRSRHTDPNGDHGEEKTDIRRLSESLADRSKVGEHCKSCPTHPARHVESSAIPRPSSRNEDFKAGRLVRIGELNTESAVDLPKPGWIYHPWTRWPLLGNQTMSTTLDRITPMA